MDVKIDIDKIDRKFLSILHQMEPFGNNFMKPVFESIVKIKEIKIIKKEHIILFVEQNDIKVKCIGFFMKDSFKNIKKNSIIKIFYNIQIEPLNNSFHFVIKNFLEI